MGRDKERLRIVIDSNVLIGALIRDNSFKARLLKNRNFLFFFPELIHVFKNGIEGYCFGSHRVPQYHNCCCYTKAF